MSGKVYLVGAGPGAADLLTVRAARLLAQADVILHDDLVSAEVLQLVRPGAQVINVGKRCGRKSFSQADINEVMVAYARRATTVIRLKSGDPAIFGRLGEEIEALRDAGIDFELVPGVSAAHSAASIAGLSLTDRRFASSVLFTTAHLKEGHGQHWRDLVRPKTTLVIYMPGKSHQTLASELIAAGLNAATPCALVSRASLPGAQVIRTTLSQLPFIVPGEAPRLLVVGEVAGEVSELHRKGELSLSPISEPQDPLPALSE